MRLGATANNARVGVRMSHMDFRDGLKKKGRFANVSHSCILYCLFRISKTVIQSTKNNITKHYLLVKMVCVSASIYTFLYGASCQYAPQDCF